MSHPAAPSSRGLYRPDQEHDACGVSFVVDLHGRRTHDLVEKGLTSLCNLEHRGATGAEPNTGDGAGILIQIPDRFLRAVVDFELPAAGALRRRHRLPARRRRPRPTRPCRGRQDLRRGGPDGPRLARRARRRVDDRRHRPGGDARRSARSSWPTPRASSPTSRSTAGCSSPASASSTRSSTTSGEAGVYFPSLSARTIVYKGMLTTPQLGEFFPDLRDERVESALALVHSRFSTNTFPSWPLAHPYRFVAHNGEINTVQGNQNWMRAREALLASDLFPGGREALERIFPICTPGASDTARLDEALELLHLGGYSLPHAVLMMIPEAWENHEHMDPADRDFYRYHACLMEPWDGPASIVLHRRHRRRRRARPQRPAPVALLGHRRRPRRHGVRGRRARHRSGDGRAEGPPAARAACSWSTPTQGRIIDDDEIKAELAAAHPYGEWLDAGPRAPRRPARGVPHHRVAHATCCASSRPSGTPTKSSSSSSSRWRATAARRSARWAPTRRSRCSRTGRGCSSTTSSSSSRR